MIQQKQYGCPACAKPVKIGQLFCKYCGFKLNEVKCPSCANILKISQKFCTSCGANLSEQIKNEKVSGAPTQLAIPGDEMANIKQLFMLKSKKKIVKQVYNLFKNYSYSLHDKIYDLIGEMLLEKPKFFMKDLFPRMYIRILNFDRNFKSPFSPQLVSEMEEYILRKFCFYKGEQIIMSSFGRLTIGKYEIRGNFYVTNRRLITIGEPVNSWGHPIHVLEADVFGLILIIPYSILYIFRNIIGTEWKKILNEEINEIKPCFGYEFPYTDLHDIRRFKKKIKFVIKYQYEDKGQTIIDTPNLGFIPLRYYKKYENKIEFQKRREEALSKINGIFNSILG